ncbi:MAG TPA: hypothetical protein VFB33_06895 [Candidatus Binataceae bacterium]|jgi:hypothetical protein|nr:hypothetical protein [Candidatus Binataceae bacterium]
MKKRTYKTLLQSLRGFRFACGRALWCASRGQSATEMAMMSLVAAALIAVALQGAITLNRGMAVRELAYQGARYAAANPNYDSSTVISYIRRSVPSALANGELDVTMSPSSAPRSQGSAVSITIAFTGSTVAIPSVISFPATVSATDIAMSE